MAISVPSRRIRTELAGRQRVVSSLTAEIGHVRSGLVRHAVDGVEHLRSEAGLGLFDPVARQPGAPSVYIHDIATGVSAQHRVPDGVECDLGEFPLRKQRVGGGAHPRSGAVQCERRVGFGPRRLGRRLKEAHSASRCRSVRSAGRSDRMSSSDKDARSHACCLFDAAPLSREGRKSRAPEALTGFVRFQRQQQRRNRSRVEPLLATQLHRRNWAVKRSHAFRSAPAPQRARTVRHRTDQQRPRRSKWWARWRAHGCTRGPRR